jgi:hypothetical protein
MGGQIQLSINGRTGQAQPLNQREVIPNPATNGRTDSSLHQWNWKDRPVSTPPPIGSHSQPGHQWEDRFNRSSMRGQSQPGHQWEDRFNSPLMEGQVRLNPSTKERSFLTRPPMAGQIQLSINGWIGQSQPLRQWEVFPTRPPIGGQIQLSFNRRTDSTLHQ